MDQTLKISRPTNPRQNAGILSLLSYTYLLPTFIKGFSKDLDVEDIPEVLEDHEAATLGNKLENSWRQYTLLKNPSLWRSIMKVFGLEFVLFGLILFFDEIVLRLVRTIALVQIVRHFSEEDGSRNDISELYIYGIIIVGTSFLDSILGQASRNDLQLLGMKMRVACASLIYRKCLKLSGSALEGMNMGRNTNLIANDLHRIEMCAVYMNYIWICPTQVVVIAVLLYYMAGLVSVVGIVLMVLLVPLQVFAGHMSSKSRSKTASHTDERIRFMSEIIAGIKVIKMYTWEKPFTNIMENIRRTEIREILIINYIRAFVKFLPVTSNVAICLAVGALTLTGARVNATYVFIVVSFYDTLKMSLMTPFPIGIIHLAEANISIKRLQELLLLEEIELNNKAYIHTLPLRDVTNVNKNPFVDLDEIKAKWYKNASNYALNGVTLQANDNQLIGIIGSVGSGKTSILHAILNELAIESGTIKVQGSISYASQKPWIFSGNIRQNILFGQSMKMNRYLEVLRICALEPDLDKFPYCDQTLVGERGIILSGGQKARISLARALYADADIYLLDDPFSAVDIHVGNHLFEQCILNFLGHKCVIVVTHQLQFLNSFHCLYVIEDGEITESGTFEKLKMATSKVIEHLHFENENTLEEIMEDPNLVKNSVIRKIQNPKEINNVNEYRCTGGIKKDVCLAYLDAGESTATSIFILMLFVLSQSALTSSNYFLAYWTNEEQKMAKRIYTSTLSQAAHSYIYTGLELVTVSMAILRCYAIFKFCTQIASGLHRRMFNSILNTSMNFFHLNNSGMILNRFTKDMGIIDESISFALSEMLQIGFHAIGNAIIVCVVNPWLIAGTAIMFILCYLVRIVHAPTSRNLARLEGTARSPVYIHINETLQGLTSIRAFNTEIIVQKEFDKHQDLHSSVNGLLITCNRTLCLYIDMICILYIAAIMIILFLFQSDQLAGNVGVALTQGIGLLTSFRWGLVLFSELETHMTSVERVVEYIAKKPEDNRVQCTPHPTWPTMGAVSFKSLSLKYNTEEPDVLKKINLNIESKQKIGIVGRTGSGKSSLITALFQFFETDGSIFIDNLDITKIPLSSLRSSISIIPQDPVLFYGTVRSNLDPFNIYPDADVWAVLEQVELKSMVSKFSLGLDHVVSDGGSNLSAGQRQLVCLGRALLKNNRILVLDEATANVDPDTDALIQNTIRTRFNECTVLTIAHRLNSIMDADKVVVMDSGKVVEYDHPHLLLQNKAGLFHSMLQKTGPSAFDLFSNQSEKSYYSKVE